MRDGLYLLLAALLFAAIGWVFWHFAGENAFGILSVVAMVVLTADNIRLRRQLRSFRPRPPAESAR